MTYPRPSIDNCINTILACDPHNRREWLNLDRIANAQGFDPVEFTVRFYELEMIDSLKPKNTYEVEGK